MLYRIPISPTRAACPSNFILHDLIKVSSRVFRREFRDVGSVWKCVAQCATRPDSYQGLRTKYAQLNEAEGAELLCFPNKCPGDMWPASGGPVAAAGDPREDTLHNHGGDCPLACVLWSHWNHLHVMCLATFLRVRRFSLDSRKEVTTTCETRV
jgi:hypothetical protein